MSKNLLILIDGKFNKLPLNIQHKITALQSVANSIPEAIKYDIFYTIIL